MSKQNWVIVVIVVALIVVLLILKGGNSNVEENILPENNTPVQNEIVEPAQIENELDQINTDAQIEEAMKLIDAELGNL